MLKNLVLAASLAAAISMSGFAAAQRPGQPTKTAPPDALTWRNGMGNTDIRLVNRITHSLSMQDKYMVWTAIVRNREASRDIFKGEPLTNDKVLANVRVRMSTDESNRWTTTWSHMNSFDRQVMVKVLRDDLQVSH